MATQTKVITLQNLERFWANVQAHYDYIDSILGSSTIADFSALGTGYSSLLALSTTMKNFLTAADASSTAINRWKEIENFLAGITDTQTLTGLLESMQTSLQTAINGKATTTQGGYADSALQSVSASGSGFITLTASAKSGGNGAKTQALSASLTVQPLSTADSSHKGLAEASDVKAAIAAAANTYATTEEINAIFTPASSES